MLLTVVGTTAIVPRTISARHGAKPRCEDNLWKFGPAGSRDDRRTAMRQAAVLLGASFVGTDGASLAARQ